MTSTHRRFSCANTVSAAGLALCLGLPFLMGAAGDGCAAGSRSAAPDIGGGWDIAYDDVLGVRITVGGTVYEETLGAAGGIIEIDHEGQPLVFDLDCARPEILCPSEAWPGQVGIEQRNPRRPHQMIVTLPTQSCSGALRDPEPDECGPDTVNESCEAICDGDISVRNDERFGVIGESGETFRLFLGAGIATNGFNCALLGVSVADADLGTIGTPGTPDWTAVTMDNGLVTVGYAGGCLWAGDPNMDGALEALVVGAAVEFTTGFSGTRAQ